MNRLTTEVGPDLPEKLLFSPREAELCVRALSYEMTTLLHAPPDRWIVKSLDHLVYPTDEGLYEIRSIAKTLQSNYDFTQKFLIAQHRPEKPTELSPREIEKLGYSLFYLGTTGVRNANEAFMKGQTLPYMDEAARANVQAKAQQTGVELYTLFKELEPIAKTREAVWMPWSNSSDTQPFITFQNNDGNW